MPTFEVSATTFHAQAERFARLQKSPSGSKQSVHDSGQQRRTCAPLGRALGPFGTALSSPNNHTQPERSAKARRRRHYIPQKYFPGRGPVLEASVAAADWETIVAINHDHHKIAAAIWSRFGLARLWECKLNVLMQATLTIDVGVHPLPLGCGCLNKHNVVGGPTRWSGVTCRSFRRLPCRSPQ